MASTQIYLDCLNMEVSLLKQIIYSLAITWIAGNNPWKPFAFYLLTKSSTLKISFCKLWKTFTDCFNCLPIAAIIDEKIFCCHGGLSPDLQNMDQIKRIMRPTDVPDTGKIGVLAEISLRLMID